MRTLCFILGMCVAVPALAQQPTVEDMRAAFAAASEQRNRAQNEVVESAVGLKRIIEAYEARLETAMGWLKTAQEHSK